jgi:putative ABC transport system substrate-binding protein
MRRREFIAGLGGTAMPMLWLRAARAQSPASPVIGILSGGPPGSFGSVESEFRKGLGGTGFVEGRNAAFAFQWASGQFDRLPQLAADLVGGRPAVIATSTLPAALAAKAATATIPIVFVIGEDPVKVGLVASLSRPGGNVTGVTNFMNVLGAKRLQLASEGIPNASVLGLLVNPKNPNAEPDTKDLQTAADALGRRLHVLNASSEHEIEAAFGAAAERKIGALFVNIDPYFFSQRERLAALAARYAVPAIYPLRDFVAAGGLMSYGASFATAWRQAGVYAGSILKGAKPADLPVLQPTKFELVINLKTAQTLGLDIPPQLLALADEVIE